MCLIYVGSCVVLKISAGLFVARRETKFILSLASGVSYFYKRTPFTATVQIKTLISNGIDIEGFSGRRAFNP